MSKPSWTAEQRTAINLRGQLLVAAAAGSGKTAVLVERIIKQITEIDNHVNVDGFLVVTFTKAAANEMKERIGKALDEALFQEQDFKQVEHLLQQRALLQRANITTLHSFCLELIRKYFYVLDLDPAFRVADEAEITLLRQDVVEALFEERYDCEDPDFIALIDAFGSDRDDLAVMEHTLRIFDFAQSQTNPLEWLKTLDQAYLWDDLETMMQSEWGQSIRQGLLDSIEEVYSLLKNAEQITQKPEGPVQYAETLQDDLNRVGLLKQLMNSSSWTRIESQVQETAMFPKLSSARSKGDKELQEECKKLRDEAKKKMNALKNELFSYPHERQLQDFKPMARIAQSMGQLVLDFSRNYAGAKRQRNILDFSDLEHFALRLLEEEDKPTLAAQGIKDFFTEVLVDEYQDINPVQERILQLVSRQEVSPNLFMVGDVKQSIYRFRMADPGLFLNKYQNLPHWNPESQVDASVPVKMVIDLNRNFRSRQEIVDGVNFLFRQIMTQGSGEISYDDQAALQYGASFVKGQDSISTAEGPIEVHLINLKSVKASWNKENVSQGISQSSDEVSNQEFSNQESSQEEFDKARIEARFVSERIQTLVEGSEFHIYDKKLGNFRPVQYSDIVVLMRSYSAVAPVYVEEFQKANIPVYAETSTGYFGASEVEIILSLLKVIDNPHQDIPLAAVLRSPLVGLNGLELGKLRMVLPEGDFYEALTLSVWAGLDEDHLSEDNQEIFSQVLNLYNHHILSRIKKAQDLLASAPGLSEKIVDFWTKLQSWRTQSRRLSLSELLWALYEETGYFTYVGTLPAGVQRQANLRVLYDRAKGFEATRYRGLFRFLRFLERFQGQGKDMGSARALGENENVVRLITVHASKGLEFPVVFVVGLGRSFNSRSLNGKLLLHSELGLGMPIIDVENNVRYPSLIQYAVQQRLAQESLAEELRILYVALTRAKERLFLYGNVENLDSALLKWRRICDWQDVSLPEELLRNAKSFLDWIIPALARHPLVDLGQGQDHTIITLPESNSAWEIFFHHNLESEQEMNHQDSPKPVSETEGEETGCEKRGIEEVKEPTKELAKEEVVDESTENLTPEQWFYEIDRRLRWKYPHPVSLVAKTSVSELKRQYNWYVDDETSQHESISTRGDQILRPKFLQTSHSLTAAERGTALHTVMQHLPFREWSTDWAVLNSAEQTIKIVELLNLLQDRDILNDEQKNSIEPPKIVQLLNTPLGLRLFCSERVLRELPFTLTFTPQKQAQTNILVQGVIDVVMIRKNGQEFSAEILDYKTDALVGRNEKPPEQLLIDRYALQLTLYALAIEKLMGIGVTQCSLYSFSLGREVIIPNSLCLEIRQTMENQLFL
ncbi:recombination helicase AddA [Desulfosporosinus acidiphilus SJ4]|uniref:ATP-dependent helicase/nuclease subunit A n=1 Tax=Desulfosporosinus acidiphilus (strain DSM 22704 / JCM 16185 / SJ4) TaxID=646529 RepID=I4D6Z0_DESAJ|nr:helicase-exonuclease AddAB subunit AddA [Desulfosporosinus acidiphilus]AFM41564.1 recombination helicase AddA [Desulfosporosinus acidiphilus SJ4]